MKRGRGTDPALEGGARVAGLPGKYTVARTDEKLRQPRRVAPDQTVRVMENKFDICDGHIWVDTEVRSRAASAAVGKKGKKTSNKRKMSES